MPYDKDLIAERDEKIKLYSSVIKWWRVQYIDREMIKKLKEDEDNLRLALEVSARLEAEAAEDEAIKQAEIAKALEEAERDIELCDEHYNPTTGTYSGVYGKNATLDEVEQKKVKNILNRKEREIEEILEEYSV